MSLCGAIHDRNFARIWVAIALLFGLALVLPNTLQAQTLVVNPAEKYYTTPGGVDLRTGRFVYNQNDLPVIDGMPFSRTLPDYAALHANPFGNFSHNWDIWLVDGIIDSANNESGEKMMVHIGGRSMTFTSTGPDYGLAYAGDGLSIFLTSSGDRGNPSTIFTFRDADGTLITFRPIGGADCSRNEPGKPFRRCAFAASMIRTDGTRLDFAYAGTGEASGNQVRLARVTSSRGFVLILEGSQTYVTKACILNVQTVAAPAANICPASALGTASYVYQASAGWPTQRLVAVADASGGQWGFSYTPSGANTLMGFTKPGQTTPWLTNTVTLRADEELTPQEVVTHQSFADGQAISYVYGLTPLTDSRPYQTIIGGAYTDNSGRSARITFGFPIKPGTRPFVCTEYPCVRVNQSPDDFLNYVYQTTPGPVEVVDELGRVTTFNYCDPVAAAGLPPQEHDRCAVVPLVSFTDLEGARTEIKYDGFRNMGEVRRLPKPGSDPALTPLVVSATYDCGNPASCTTPVTSTDAKGSVINRTYAPGHGGLLTEMLPAPVAGGARPLKVLTYTQRSAWTYDANGVLAEGQPVWVPAGSTECQSVPGSSSPVCDPSAPQVVTVLEYGANGTAEALLVKGQAVTSGTTTLRTCYRYDAAGRRVSQTDPRANLGVCP